MRRQGIYGCGWEEVFGIQLCNYITVQLALLFHLCILLYYVSVFLARSGLGFHCLSSSSFHDAFSSTLGCMFLHHDHFARAGQ